MQLKLLRIYTTDGKIESPHMYDEIREVSFKPGLNLILDDGVGLGNSVGKTTFLNIIDLCLGNKHHDKLHKDEESAASENIVKKFLKDKKVFAELHISNFVIKRPLYTSSEYKFANLNGHVVTMSELRSSLMKELFGTVTENPTFPQLLSKFIRTNSHEMEHVLNYLESTKNSVYRLIRLFLFGNFGNKITQELDALEDSLRFMKRGRKLIYGDYEKNEIDQVIIQKKKIIEGLQNKRQSYDVSDNIFNMISDSTDIENKLTDLRRQQEVLRYKVTKNEESLRKIGDKRSLVKASDVKDLYDEASIFLPELNKKFDEYLQMHYQMLENESLYISKHITSLKAELSKVESMLRRLSETELSIRYAKELDAIIKEITLESEALGMLEERVSKINEYEGEKETAEKRIEELQNKLNDIRGLVDERLAVFNEIFQRYYSMIFNSNASVLYYDDAKGVNLKRDDERSGAGKKTGEIVAFDLAYFTFADAFGIQCPRFLLHDRLELTDENHKKVALTEILPQIDCQLILPALKSSLAFLGDEFIKENKILELTKEDKLFRIEQF